MDPLSITTACLTLLGTVGKTSLAVATFIRGCREARSDLTSISGELTQLELVLDLLKDDAAVSDDRVIPESLQMQVLSIINNCSAVVDRINAVLQKHSGKTGAAKWVAFGKSEVAGLRMSLEAHRGSLNLVLELVSVSLSKAIRDDVAVVRTDVHDIKQDTGHIPEIMAELTRLRAIVAGGEITTATRGQNFVLEQYLDSLTSYAETVCNDVVWDSDRSSHTHSRRSSLEQAGGSTSSSHTEQGQATAPLRDTGNEDNLSHQVPETQGAIPVPTAGPTADPSSSGDIREWFLAWRRAMMAGEEAMPTVLTKNATDARSAPADSSGAGLETKTPETGPTKLDLTAFSEEPDLADGRDFNPVTINEIEEREQAWREERVRQLRGTNYTPRQPDLADERDFNPVTMNEIEEREQAWREERAKQLGTWEQADVYPLTAAKVEKTPRPKFDDMTKFKKRATAVKLEKRARGRFENLVKLEEQTAIKGTSADVDRHEKPSLDAEFTTNEEHADITTDPPQPRQPVQSGHSQSEPLELRMPLKIRQPNLTRRRRLVVIGDSSVGKSTLCKQFLNLVNNSSLAMGHSPKTVQFYDCTEHTVALEIDGISIVLNIFDYWPPRSDDHFPLNYPSGTHAVLICFGIDSSASLVSARTKWAPEVRKRRKDLPIFLVGLKRDRRDETITTTQQLKGNKLPPGALVIRDEALIVAGAIGAERYFEPSSLAGQGVIELFEEVIRFTLKPPEKPEPTEKPEPAKKQSRFKALLGRFDSRV
ncbi:hypothetical protein QBC47DRAFT_378573 [Echria macrotheca]|uniref:Azaphilone pigments biosynthesis cluster protein L N-terminal domain-containing protein n=1 Tax=Echria macrotheca TaxID=438768 RepID=A0AAJ0FD35_9PEZI|nr:hypothetical protein QBC47DRAFT_378573 [Echria macrotheca]